VKVAKALPLLLTALLAAGCGTVAATAPHTTAAGTHTAKASLVSRQPPARTPGQRAAAEARAILAQFVPPPGAIRLAKQPTLPSGSGTTGLVYTTVAQAAGYWQVRGKPTTLLAWEKTHMPPSFSRQDVIVGPPAWNTLYTLPSVPGVFAARELNAQFYDVGGGLTVIAADAMVAWEPPRPATEAVPASVTAVTITGSSMASPEQATITSAAAVRRLAALVNGLSLSTIGPLPCPSGWGFTLTFRTLSSGPPTAVAEGPAGCGTVTFRLNGKDQPDLMALSQTAYDSAVLKIAGLPWKLP
jgi:hypothetical protein